MIVLFVEGPRTLVGHGDGVVGVGGAHVEDDHRRGVLGRGVPDLVPVGAVSRGDQGDPGPGLLRHREPGVRVAGLAIQRGRGQDHHPPGVPLRGVLPVPAALRLLGAQLGGGRVHVGDVDEGGVPLLPLGHGEVQAQQVDEAEGQQPGGEGQAAAGRHQRARGHGGAPLPERGRSKDGGRERFSSDTYLPHHADHPTDTNFNNLWFQLKKQLLLPPFSVAFLRWCRATE